MKELRFWLIFFSVLACIIWFAGRITRAELPGRGVWDGRTFTNEESGICLTVPEGYQIYTDAEIIKMYHRPEDYYKNVKSQTSYFDMQIGSGNSMMYTVYMVLDPPCSAAQYINRLEVSHGGDQKSTSSKFEKVLCGQTYSCLGITYEGEKTSYLLWCTRYIPGKGLVYIQIQAENKEKADEMLASFDTETVSAGKFREICWWFEKVL